MESSFWRLRILCFHSELPHSSKRCSNGVHGFARAGSPTAIDHSLRRGPPHGVFNPHESRNRARKPSCSKCRSFVRASVRPSRRIVCIDMQSVRL